MHSRPLAVTAFTLAALLAGCEQGKAQPATFQMFKEVHAIGQTDEIATYADAATLEREGPIVTLWLLSAYKPEAEPEPGIRFVEARERYDCEAGTQTLLRIRAIRRDGSTLEDFTFDTPRTAKFNPEGVFGLSAQAFCVPGELEGRRVVDDYRRDAMRKLKID